MMQIISSIPYVSPRQLVRQQRLATSLRFLLLAAFMSLSFLLLLSLLSGRPWTDPMVNLVNGTAPTVPIPPTVPVSLDTQSK
jgi:hypothetical protein